MLDTIVLMARGGATNPEMAEAFGVTIATFQRWLAENEDFREAVKGARAGFDDRIEHSLAMRALGYRVHEEDIKVIDGKVVRVPVVKHVPPSDTAIIFWLKNRRPNEWRDKRDIELNDVTDSVTDDRKLAMAVLHLLGIEAGKELELRAEPIEPAQLAAPTDDDDDEPGDTLSGVRRRRHP